MKNPLLGLGIQSHELQPNIDLYWWSYRVLKVGCFGVARALRESGLYAHGHGTVQVPTWV